MFKSFIKSSRRASVAPASKTTFEPMRLSKLDIRKSPLRTTLMDTLSLLTPMSCPNVEKVRVGRSYDGGYVMLSDLSKYGKALSLGISGDDSWDLAMVRRGYVIHQYDYSITQAPTQHEQLTFFPLKIAAESNSTNITLEDAVSRLAPNPNERLILKMDIEGSEWDVLTQTRTSTLRRFSQIVCEVHGLAHLSEPLQHERIRNALSIVHDTHQSVHVHANNYGELFNVDNVPVPDVLELTFANRDLYKFNPSNELYPTSLDQPNNPEVADIFLGNFKFK